MSRPNGQQVIPAFSRDQEIHAYREMLLIRRFEERAGQLYGMGLIGGFCHLYIGQEAVVVGMQMAIRAGRSGDHHLSRPRPYAGLRHGPQGSDGGADRETRRLLQGQGRLHAHVLQGEELLRRTRHRRRQRAVGCGHRLRQRLPRQRQRVPHLFRRRRRQPGPGVRDLQHGQAVEAAGHLHHREQQVCDGHLHRALGGDDGFLPARALVRHSGRAGGRHGRARGEGRGRSRGEDGCGRATGPTSWRC